MDCFVARLTATALILPFFATCHIGQSLQAQTTAQTRTWSNATTLSYVATSGNSSTNTLGFSNDFVKKWNLTSLALKGGMIRSETTLTSVSATGESLDDAVVKESKSSSVTADRYYLNARLDYRIKDKDRWYWYGGSSWERNLPVGLDERLAASAGLGRILADAKKTKWRVDVGLGITKEKPVIASGSFQKDFGTLNLTSELKHTFNGNINYNADLAFTYNLKNSDDWLTVFKQGITLTMTKGTAIKVGFDLNYRNMPSLISVKAYTPNNPPVFLGDIILRAKKLETITTTSLVVKF